MLGRNRQEIIKAADWAAKIKGTWEASINVDDQILNKIASVNGLSKNLISRHGACVPLVGHVSISNCNITFLFTRVKRNTAKGLAEAGSFNLADTLSGELSTVVLDTTSNIQCG